MKEQIVPNKMQKIAPNASAPTVRVTTLGCKVNFCDGNALLAALVTAGFAATADGRPADVEVLNTCAVTSRSVQKARCLIRRVRAANPSAVVLVTGCAARLPERALHSIPEADDVCLSAPDVLAWLGGRYGIDTPGRPAQGGLDPGRTRAFVKVQDGCEAFCSYCVVPLVRGACRSVEPEMAAALVREAVERGYREVVLCGIHLGHYGRDLSGVSLAGLVRDVAALPGRFRVRLSSIEPLEVTPELLQVMSAGDRFCPHLHLPLQSGSDAVLKAMRRPYTAGQYLEIVEMARKILNNPAITTDIMVGFPGETEADHLSTLEVAARAGFARVHTFVFSPRRGTSAADMPGRVPAPDARRRSLEVRAACASTALRFRKTLVGTTAEVIVESAAGGFAEGLCRRYQRVRFPGGRELIANAASVYIIGDGGAGGVLEARPASREEA
jgi:threonylcarbamoyladenosine tRNA methylthiotransferase MtaB